ncbi:MAG: hypothetical protein H6625_05910 [Bdellovibrionaceae bacterium]|nr:hypothetical protein [Pseudobdellovibrionaceae bacterium]
MENTFKWAELARNHTPLRFDILSEYLNEKGFKNEFTALVASPLDFEEKLKTALKNYQALRLGSPFGLQVINLFDFLPANISALQAADSIILKSGQWELTASTLIGFEKHVLSNGKNIKLDASVLIVGSGATAKFAIHAISKIGIKNIKISNQFSEQAKQLILDLERKYFGIKFEFVPDDQLVLLPGTNSVLINTTPLIDSNSILNELYYFNFLRPDGLVIDFTFLPLNTPLIIGAEQIGIRVVKGYEVCAWGDLQWAKNFTDIPLNYEEYKAKILKAGINWEKENLSSDKNEVKDGPRF